MLTAYHWSMPFVRYMALTPANPPFSERMRVEQTDIIKYYQESATEVDRFHASVQTKRKLKMRREIVDSYRRFSCVVKWTDWPGYIQSTSNRSLVPTVAPGQRMLDGAGKREHSEQAL